MRRRRRLSRGWKACYAVDRLDNQDRRRQAEQSVDGIVDQALEAEWDQGEQQDGMEIRVELGDLVREDLDMFDRFLCRLRSFCNGSR